MDDDADSQGLLQTVLGLFIRRRPPLKSAEPAPLEVRKRQAWLRTDAFLQQDDIGEADPESVARTLRAFEQLVQGDSGGEMDFVGILGVVSFGLLTPHFLPAHLPTYLGHLKVVADERCRAELPATRA